MPKGKISIFHICVRLCAHVCGSGCTLASFHDSEPTRTLLLHSVWHCSPKDAGGSLVRKAFRHLQPHDCHEQLGSAACSVKNRLSIPQKLWRTQEPKLMFCWQPTSFVETSEYFEVHRSTSSDESGAGTCWISESNQLPEVKRYSAPTTYVPGRKCKWRSSKAIYSQGQDKEPRHSVHGKLSGKFCIKAHNCVNKIWI